MSNENQNRARRENGKLGGRPVSGSVRLVVFVPVAVRVWLEQQAAKLRLEAVGLPVRAPRDQRRLGEVIAGLVAQQPVAQEPEYLRLARESRGA